ncbi:glucose/arabinose dehydrogenase [Saccharopolyspora lacisalsi]|uniref:Glucose/arabinose dehydrogenase n=1 Tax=Halosaccharopolyspora lacisalsi TaxID=1000566 RepID=A0A839E539_9PSEU|nr:PQQ-dependent sugar dehydrogenase [Halosaccharopolyspora lacisalsi]MBA8826451.1 glucose/arabinose dehydrogenase [Halosaccharopolyspora lacisalsi]
MRSGQDLSTLFGKVIRIDVGGRCGDRPYCAPESNPFTDAQGARSEIWSSGLRNPWKFSFDPANGSLWIADVGRGSHEEINHVLAGAGGRSFGWSCREGPEVFDASRCDPDADHVDPVLSYRTPIDGCAVIGGRVYRGQRHSELAGAPTWRTTTAREPCGVCDPPRTGRATAPPRSERCRLR